MLSAFVSGLGGEFAKQWVARVLTPAFAFWAGGAAALWWHEHGDAVAQHGWAGELSTSTAWLHDLPGVAQGLILVGGLVLLAASAFVAERLTTPLLRLLEGYWSRPRWLRNALVAHRRRRYGRWMTRLEPLARRERFGDLTLEEFIEFGELRTDVDLNPARLQELQTRQRQGRTAAMLSELGRGRAYLHEAPLEDHLGMPTRLGDVLRAAEMRPAYKYGLDSIACWTALWLLLPADTKSELAQARSALDNAARGCLWGALFVVWTPWTWWALPIGLAVAALMYYGGILPEAQLFGELIVTAYDLHRFKLYDSLRLPRPTTPARERQHDGPLVTHQLWRRLDDDVTYVEPVGGSAGSSKSGAEPTAAT